jgi:nucleoside-diphosphate-sugar epimerase
MVEKRLLLRLLVTGGSGFIGSSFVDEATLRGGYTLLNLDLHPPKDGINEDVYRQCDLLDLATVKHYFSEFQPTHVVHFAGRTDMFGADVSAYAANHIGTENIIAAIQQTPSVQQCVFTSSQFVFGPGSLPTHDEDYRPHTIYGESKVLSEKAVRTADLACEWSIIRPTNIWGKRHPRYPTEFWKVLKQGRYVHPGGARVTRCYGYVGTVVDQVLTILGDTNRAFDRKTFYVGDAPIDLFEWTNAFSLELTGRPVRVVPNFVLRGIALVGDVVILAGGKFPLFSSRYRSMTESYVTPMEATFAALGPSKYSMKDGVKQTADWLRSTDPFWR